MEFEVRSYDVDFAGVVSNLVYHRWMEDLRIAVMSQAFTLREAFDQGLVPTVAQTLIDYRSPLRLGDHARGRQAITAVGVTSFVFETEMRRARDGAVVAAARHTVVFVNAETGKPQPVPDAIRKLRTAPSFTIHLRGIDSPGPEGRTT